MSRNSVARSTSLWMLRNRLIEVDTFTVAATAGTLVGLLVLGLFLAVPYMASFASNAFGELVTEAATPPSPAPAYVWWGALIVGAIASLRISWHVFWKVEPIAGRYFHDRFGAEPPTYPLDDTDTY